MTAAAPARAAPEPCRSTVKTVAEGRIDKTVPVYFSTDDTFDVGEDWGTPMSDSYDTPFAFTGKIKKVTVQANGTLSEHPPTSRSALRRFGRGRSRRPIGNRIRRVPCGEGALP